MSVESLHRRARAIRSRHLIRQRQFAQRDLAAGVWLDLRYELAAAQAAFAITEDTARTLEHRGHPPSAAGLRIDPPLRAYVIDEAELKDLPPARALAIRMDPALLRAGYVVLVRFPTPRPEQD